jgi:hypothetical protein
VIGDRMQRSPPPELAGGPTLTWYRRLFNFLGEVRDVLETALWATPTDGYLLTGDSTHAKGVSWQAPALTWDSIADATATTTDATVTTCGTYNPTTAGGGFIEAIVIGERSTDGITVAFVLRAAFDDTAGTPTLSNISQDSLDSLAATTDATLDVSGGVIRCRVTGVAATTYNWRSRIHVLVRA